MSVPSVSTKSITDLVTENVNLREENQRLNRALNALEERVNRIAISNTKKIGELEIAVKNLGETQSSTLMKTAVFWCLTGIAIGAVAGYFIAKKRIAQ